MSLIASPFEQPNLGRGILLLRGMGYPFRAVAFMQTHRLWRYAVLPTLISISVAIVLALGLWWHLLPWVDHLQQRSLAWDETAQHWAGGAYHLLVRLAWWVVLPPLVVAAIGLMAWLGQLLAGPFLYPLSQRTESLATGRPPPPRSLRASLQLLVVGLSDGLLSLLLVPLAWGMLVLLLLIPGLGAVICLGWVCLFVAQQFVGIAMLRRGIAYSLRWQIVLANRWPCFGFGLVIAAGFALPIVNFLVLPVACCAGTLLCVDLDAARRLSAAAPR